MPLGHTSKDVKLTVGYMKMECNREAYFISDSTLQPWFIFLLDKLLVDCSCMHIYFMIKCGEESEDPCVTYSAVLRVLGKSHGDEVLVLMIIGILMVSGIEASCSWSKKSLSLWHCRVYTFLLPPSLAVIADNLNLGNTFHLTCGQSYHSSTSLKVVSCQGLLL